MADPYDDPIPELSLDEAADLARRLFGRIGEPRWLGGEHGLNAHVATAGLDAVLRVVHPAEDPQAIELQIAALEHIGAVDRALEVPRVVPSIAGPPVQTTRIDGRDHLVWMTSFLPGVPLPSGPLRPATAEEIGAVTSRVQHSLRGFFHPAAGRRIPWDVRQCASLMQRTDAIDDEGLRRLVHATLERTADLAPSLAALPSQVIHHDLNRDNLLHAPDDPSRITGVLDLGDILHGSRVQDLAIAAAYAALDHDDPVTVVAQVVEGYRRAMPLSDDELDVLPDLIAARLAQSLTVAAHRSRLHPAHAERITTDVESVTATLEQWSRIDRALISRRIAGQTRTNVMASGELLERRRRAFWSGLRLSYRNPLHLVEGRGAWLFDADGRRYLDAYNNVPQVGHGNPRVVAAASAHARRLNTNVRYLSEVPVILAEELAELLPGPLEVCFLVNSGSEANDLAWRIATTLTGRRGAVVTTNAYHGWTDALHDMSPEERRPGDLPRHVTTMAPPSLDGPNVEEGVDSLAERGRDPAAVWVEATFASDGIHEATPEYLDSLAAAARNHGALLIADEVQGGLGRVGSDFWAFAAGDAVPDIVTLGKPLGNGYPIGAVVTSRAIADRFAEDGYFFSTFGGNQVSAAAAREVLAITAERGLAARADAIGARLRQGLPDALAPLGVPAVVRGRGALIGVELPTRELAKNLVETMRVLGVLVRSTGPEGNVVKIRPPLVIDDDQLDLLLAAAAEAAETIS